MGREAVEREMRELAGTPMAVLDQVPDEVVDAEWQLLRWSLFDETLIPNRYRALIAVAAVLRCRYAVRSPPAVVDASQPIKEKAVMQPVPRNPFFRAHRRARLVLPGVALLAALALAAPVSAQPVTALVSVNAGGTATGNNLSQFPVISADGTRVAFLSQATDLVGTTDTNNSFDVFVRDLATGTTTLVSVNAAGTATGNNISDSPVISADGTRVAFRSFATDLVGTTDTNAHSDVFVRDLATGTTTLVSVNAAGTATGNGRSDSPVISADGTGVAFRSEATDLVGTTDGNSDFDVFVRDLATGTTALVSVNAAGTATGNSFSDSPVISADGNRVAFRSLAFNLVGTTDTTGSSDVFVRDLTAGTTTLASVNAGGTAAGNNNSDSPAISADGDRVAFHSLASDLVGTPDPNGTSDVFVRHLTAGTTALASVNAGGTATGNSGSFFPVISADGTGVAFYSFATDLVTGTTDTNGASDVFVRDLAAGTTALASVNAGGTATGNGVSDSPAISADGTRVAFQSRATDLVTGTTDANGASDVFVRDLTAGTTALVSVNAAGTATGNGGSDSPVISADGTRVAFVSRATDLVTGTTDTNRVSDVFLRDLAAGAAEADLSVSIADDPDPMSQYGVVTYTMTVSNAGPDPATGTTLSATVPSGLATISVAPSQGTCTLGSGTVSCALGTVASGAQATVTVRAVATATGTPTVSASVSATEQDPTLGDNTDSEGTTVAAIACTIVGTNGNDTLTGTAGNNVICGLKGNDTIDGAGGHDVVVGGGGADNLTGGTGNDSLLGGSGGDTLTSTDGVSGNDLLAGGPQTDSCTGDPASGGVAGDAKTGCP